MGAGEVSPDCQTRSNERRFWRIYKARGSVSESRIVSGIGSGGGGKTPLALTTLRGETLADMNRGRLRGWVWIGSAVLVVLAILAWPNLIIVLVSASLAVGMVLVGVWIHLALPGAETDEASKSDDGEPRDFTTGGRD